MFDVQTSPEDKRQYRRITLANQLAVVLIHDPEMSADDPMEDGEEKAAEDPHDEGSHEDGEDEGDEDGEGGPEGGGRPPTKKAAAAMCVGVGSFSDPPDAQGLSHFLEHMLFMGSEKYPDENDYDAFLTRFGGMSNAFTETETTCYYFDVQPHAFRDALDRFAQFFIAPLCKAGAMEREVQAVDSEFHQVLQSDSCRLLQLQCHTSKAGHIFRKFSWGNRKSLVELPAENGVDVRGKLLEHYAAHYLAQRMSLCVLGAQPLDELQRWVEEIFGGIRSDGTPRAEFSQAGFPLEGGVLYRSPAVKEAHEMHVCFQLPCLHAHYLKKADDYVSHLVGHEGAGSLLSALKAKGWATGVCAGVSEGGYDRSTACYMFGVTVSLTESGLEHETDVADLLFQYLRLLQAEGPQEWVFQELRDIAAMKFRFHEEEDAADYCVRLSGNMHLFAPEHAVAGEYLYSEWDPELVRTVLAHMGPRAARLDVVSSDYAGAREAEMAGQEPWFGLRFKEEQVPEATLARWESSAPDPALAFPPRNRFLPTDFALRSAGLEPPAPPEGWLEGAPTPPTLVGEGQGVRVWHKLDHTFATPRAVVYVQICSPRSWSDPAAAAGTHLFLKLLEDALCETTYLADVAGLYSCVSQDHGRLELKVEGFSDKIPALTEAIFQSLRGFRPDPASFGRVHEALVRTYRNYNMKPTRHASYLRLLGLKPSSFPAEERLAALEATTCESMAAFTAGLLEQTHVEVLVHGNIDLDAALAVGKVARAGMGGGLMAAAARPAELCARIPEGRVTVHRAPVINPEEPNSVVECYYQAGRDSLRERALAELVDQLVMEPCYDELRTKEQLGYTVSSGMRLTHGVVGFAVIVQSAAYPPPHCTSRVEAFLASFGRRLEEMSDAEFDRNREALIAHKLHKDKVLTDEASRHWEQIWARRFAFQERFQEVEELRALTRADAAEWFRERLAPSSPARRLLVVQVYGKEHQDQKSAGAMGPAPPGFPVWPVEEVASMPALAKSLPAEPTLAREPDVPPGAVAL